MWGSWSFCTASSRVCVQAIVLPREHSILTALSCAQSRVGLTLTKSPSSIALHSLAPQEPSRLCRLRRHLCWDSLLPRLPHGVYLQSDTLAQVDYPGDPLNLLLEHRQDRRISTFSEQTRDRLMYSVCEGTNNFRTPLRLAYTLACME
jgi:hypothetical protein